MGILNKPQGIDMGDKAVRSCLVTDLRYHPWAFRDAPVHIKHDKQMIATVLMQDGMLLEYVSDELKQDRKIGLMAVSRNGSALCR